MHYSCFIIKEIDAEKLLALKLEHALIGVKDNVIQQVNQIGDGAMRLAWYMSCFTDNYQDVCSTLKNEDVRFIKALIKPLKNRNVIIKMIELYINELLRFRDAKKIAELLMQKGVKLSSSILTSKSLVYSISSAVSLSFLIDTTVRRMVKSVSTTIVFGLNSYGIVEKAAESARNLKINNMRYYNALHREELEMLFFLIEPVFTREYNLMSSFASDEDIASALAWIIK